MTEKMGRSLAANGQFEVSVIGYPTRGQVPDGIRSLPLDRFKRLSPQRWLARWKTFQLALTERPVVFIFSTHELIIAALALKILLGTRIVYDVRENYYRNILHSEGLPRLIRWPLAMLVRLKEKVFAPMIDHFILAEKGYEKEFRFHRGGWTVIENKAGEVPGRLRRMDPQHITLLFSGTLSESTGVFRAITFAEALHRAHPGVQLVIAGFAASVSVQKRILAATQDKAFIRTVGIDSLVPHAEILSLIASADAGLIAYAPSPTTVGSTPTKLFEYLQARLPILTERGWSWIARFESCAPFVLVDFENPEAQSILNSLLHHTFYTEPPRETAWSEEASRLVARVKLIV